MKNPEEIAKKVEETLAVLDRLEIAGPKPFFYTRLMARMEKQASPSKPTTYKKLEYAFYGVILLLAINGYSIYKSQQWRWMEQETSMDNFIENYHLDTRNVYVINENDFN